MSAHNMTLAVAKHGRFNVSAVLSLRWSVALCAVASLGLSTAAAGHFDDEHVVVARVAGADRIDTAVRLATHVPLDRMPCVTGVPGVRCQGVVIAQAGGYADALAGGPLASNHSSPLLLSHSDRLPDPVAEAVRAREAEIAWVLGGHAAISAQVEDDLRAAGVERVVRIAGKDRFDTARKIALTIHQTNPPGPGRPADLFIAAGSHPDPDRGWPDALAAGALAGSRPLLLVEQDRLPEATREALEEIDPGRVTIVGGTAAVSAQVEAELRMIVDQVERIAGADRYETAWLAAQHAVAERGGGDRLWLATGQDWPDALAAAPAISASRGVLLLAHPDSLGHSPQVRAWAAHYRDEFTFVRIIGGLGAVGLSVEDELRRSTEPCHPAYPDVCIGPPPPVLSCEQVGYRDIVVTGEDPHGFDRGADGLACPAA